MKICLLGLLGLVSLGLWADTRTVSRELAAETKGLFAVPNGCSFVRATATDAAGHVDYLILAPHNYVALWEKFKDARAAAHPEVAFAVKDLACYSGDSPP